MAEKILVVDDDVDTISYLRTLLTHQGYQVLEAENGIKALELAHSKRPDLIILDIMMPNMDGYEVARSLRRHPETALIPILMFTAKTQIEDKVAGYEAGVDIYLSKPVHPVEMQANIKALLVQKKARTGPLPGQGYLIGIVAAKGGLGVSTVALNLALAYNKKKDVKVIATELRPGQGTWAQELGLTSPDGLTQLLRTDVMDITTAAIEERLTLTPYGIRLLLASDKSKDVELVMSVPQYEAILQQLPHLSPLNVLDIGTNVLPAFDIIMNACNEMVVVIEPQPTVVNRTRLLVDELKGKGFGSSKVLNVVILHRTRADMAMSMSQVEDTLGQSVTLGIPPGPEQAYHAAINAKPLITVQPEGLVAQQFFNLAEHIAHRVPKF